MKSMTYCTDIYDRQLNTLHHSDIYKIGLYLQLDSLQYYRCKPICLCSLTHLTWHFKPKIRFLCLVMEVTEQGHQSLAVVQLHDGFTTLVSNFHNYLLYHFDTFGSLFISPFISITSYYFYFLSFLLIFIIFHYFESILFYFFYLTGTSSTYWKKLGD